MNKTDDARRDGEYTGYDYRPAPSGGSAAPPSVPPTASQSYAERKKAGRRGRGLRRFAVMLGAVAVMLGLAFGITSILENRHAAAQPDPQPRPEPNLVTSLPLADEAPEEEAEPAQPLGELPAVDNTSWNFANTVEGAHMVPLTSASSKMLALPENGRVDMSYFDTAVFVGDSLTQGLQLYSQGIPNAQYCAYKGISPKQMYDGSIQTRLDGVKEVPMEALVGYAPDNVYVLLGTNAMVGMGDEALLAYYSELLDALRANLHPEVCIYVQSITPVLQGRDARFDFDRIAGLNNALAQMACEKGLYFLDLHEALSGDDGWMRLDYGARDGYHMNPSGYAAWVEYLVTHTAYNRRHAHLYQEGDHYYTQLAPPAEEG